MARSGNVIAIAAGEYHNLALKADGTVIAWGGDGNGQLGNGPVITAIQSAPVVVADLPGTGTLAGVSAIAAGGAHSLALKSDGTVVAWGSDIYGQLGNGAMIVADRSAPVEVLSIGGIGLLSNVVAIAAGNLHSLALTSVGAVVAWGTDGNGQLGNGAVIGDQPAPVAVLGVGGSGTLTDVTAIAAGALHNLALRSDGTVVGWGNDFYGQLGNGATTGDQPCPSHCRRADWCDRPQCRRRSQPGAPGRRGVECLGW